MNRTYAGMKLLLNAVFKEELEGGYSALCVELGVASQGETIEEARENLKEAVDLYLESAEQLGTLATVLEEAGIDTKKKDDILSAKFLTSPLEAEVGA